eukprot:6149199-Pyramimonas_sp.AAC.1
MYPRFSRPLGTVYARHGMPLTGRSRDSVASGQGVDSAVPANWKPPGGAPGGLTPGQREELRRDFPKDVAEALMAVAQVLKDGADANAFLDKCVSEARIFSCRTNQTQEVWVYSHARPIRHKKR